MTPTDQLINAFREGYYAKRSRLLVDPSASAPYSYDDDALKMILDGYPEELEWKDVVRAARKVGVKIEISVRPIVLREAEKNRETHEKQRQERRARK